MSSHDKQVSTTISPCGENTGGGGTCPLRGYNFFSSLAKAAATQDSPKEVSRESEAGRQGDRQTDGSTAPPDRCGRGGVPVLGLRAAHWSPSRSRAPGVASPEEAAEGIFEGGSLVCSIVFFFSPTPNFIEK